MEYIHLCEGKEVNLESIHNLLTKSLNGFSIVWWLKNFLIMSEDVINKIHNEIIYESMLGKVWFKFSFLASLRIRCKGSWNFTKLILYNK